MDDRYRVVIEGALTCTVTAPDPESAVYYAAYRYCPAEVVGGRLARAWSLSDDELHAEFYLLSEEVIYA